MAYAWSDGTKTQIIDTERGGQVRRVVIHTTEKAEKPEPKPEPKPKGK